MGKLKDLILQNPFVNAVCKITFGISSGEPLKPIFFFMFSFLLPTRIRVYLELIITYVISVLSVKKRSPA